MRNAAFCVLAILTLAACGRDAGDASPAPIERAAVEAIDVPASDQLPELAAAATGIAFWSHPALAFNSMIIVASANGVAGYNIEDGAEAAAIPGINAGGVAVSYIGADAEARGVLAVYLADESAFRFYEIDNATRSLKPAAAMIAVRGHVRGFCFGRAAGGNNPTLYVVQKDAVAMHDIIVEGEEFIANTRVTVNAPASIEKCAVDPDDGSVVLAGGAKLLRMNGEIIDTRPFATTSEMTLGGVAIILSEIAGNAAPKTGGAVIVLDSANGSVQLFDREDGNALGAFKIAATDDLGGIGAAVALGATGANLGGLYRNGAIALAASGDAPSLKLVSIGGVFNALSLTLGEPFNPRGKQPQSDLDEGLIINTGYQPN